MGGGGREGGREGGRGGRGGRGGGMSSIKADNIHIANYGLYILQYSDTLMGSTNLI